MSRERFRATAKPASSCPLPLLRDRRGVRRGRGRAGPLCRGRRADTRRPRRGAAAGARSRVALVRPRRSSRPSRCARHGRLAPRRGLLAGCLGPHRRPRPRRPGAAAALLRAPPFALERLEQLGDDQLVYRFAKPQPDGRTELRLTPLELIERLAALIPPPRLHRHRYHGVLAPNSPLRAQVTAWRQPPALARTAASWRSRPAPRALARALSLGAAVGAHLRDFAPALRAVRGPDAHHRLRHRRRRRVKTILAHLGEPTTPPEVAPARGPPLWDQAPEPWPTGMTPQRPCPSSSSTSA